MEETWQSLAKEAQLTPVYGRLPLEFIDNDPNNGIHKCTVKIVSNNKIIVPSYAEAKKLYFKVFLSIVSHLTIVDRDFLESVHSQEVNLYLIFYNK